MTELEKKFRNFEYKANKIFNDEEKINFYIDYRNYLISNNPEEALNIINKLYLEYLNHENLDLKYRILLCYGNTLIVLERFKEAIEIIFKCIDYYLSNNDKKNLTISIGNLAAVFLRLEIFNYAVYLWKIVLTKYIDPNNNYLVNLTINNIMMVYMQYYHKIIYSEKTLEDIIYFYKNKKNLSRSELYLFLYTKHNLSRYYALIKNHDKAIEILENLLIEYQNNHIVSQQLDVFYELGVLYKQKENEEKMIYCFKKVIQIGESINVKLLLSNIFHELYTHYKKKGDFKKALQSIEKYQIYKKHELDLKDRITLFIKEIGIDHSNLDKNLLNIFNNNPFNDSFVFLENINNNIVKIDIFEILYAEKEDNVIKLYLSNAEVISIKSTFKKLFSQLSSVIPNSNIFFEINSRDLFINLFWISKVNFENKKVFLRPFHNEVSFQISKRQWINFKQLIEQKI